ncbi:hypothetical protein ABM90_04000 [Rhodococcus erythropolis]|nr:hypothetical protein ABM90_04000 [Rhodococcus erythropolis]
MTQMSSTIFIFDTNIVLGTPRLDDVAWKKMFLVRDFGPPFRLVVPEVVVREFGRRRFVDAERRRAKGIKSWGTALFDLAAAGVDLPAEVPSVRQLRDRPTLSRAEHTAELKANLAKRGVDIEPIPAADHDVLVEWSLSEHPPFDETDKGYRDALIWESVKVVAAGSPANSEIVFVTNDKDFCGSDGDSGALHQDLIADLESVTPNEVVVAKSISEAMTLTKLESVHAELSADDFDLYVDIPQLIKAAIPSACDDIVGMELPDHRSLDFSHEPAFQLTLPDLEGPIIITDVIPHLDLPTVDVQEAFEGDTQIGEARFLATVTCSGQIRKSEISDSDVKWDVQDADFSDHYMEVATSVEAELSFRFLVIGNEVDSLEFESGVQVTPAPQREWVKTSLFNED